MDGLHKGVLFLAARSDGAVTEFSDGILAISAKQPGS